MVQFDIKTLLTKYLLRQEIVFDALGTLHLDKLYIYHTNRSDVDILTLVEAYKDVPQCGIWRKYGTWDYYMHGLGCRLINTITNEPLEWDVPSSIPYPPTYVATFNRNWFLNWCEWFVKTCHQDLSRDQLQQVFDTLIESGFIRLIEQGNYELSDAQ